MQGGIKGAGGRGRGGTLQIIIYIYIYIYYIYISPVSPGSTRGDNFQNQRPALHVLEFPLIVDGCV